MPHKETAGNVSRLMLYFGWIIPLFLIRLLLPLYKSLWAYMPVVGADLLNLAYVFIALAITAIGLMFCVPRRHADVRLNLILVMIFCIDVAIEIILDVLYNWSDIVWF